MIQRQRRSSECQRVQAMLSAHLDRRLPSGEARTVEEHLARCASCQEELLGLRATVAALRALPLARVPRSFTIEAPPARRLSPWYFRCRNAAGAVAAVLVALLAFQYSVQQSLPARSSPAIAQRETLSARPGAVTNGQAPTIAESGAEARAQSAAAPTAPAASPIASAAPGSAPVAPPGGAPPASAPVPAAPAPAQPAAAPAVAPAQERAAQAKATGTGPALDAATATLPRSDVLSAGTPSPAAQDTPPSQNAPAEPVSTVGVDLPLVPIATMFEWILGGLLLLLIAAAVMFRRRGAGGRRV